MVEILLLSVVVCLCPIAEHVVSYEYTYIHKHTVQNPLLIGHTWDTGGLVQV